MRQYTTPTLNITLKKNDGTIADDIVYDYLIFSLKSACFKIEKTVQFEQVVDGKFSIEFTQEETSRLNINEQIEMEINFFQDDKRFATNIKKMRVDKNLLNRVVR